MKQTAVEWLVSRLLVDCVPLTQKDINKAKEMEKKQIIESNKSGQHYADNFEVPHEEEAVRYYNETFKSE